MTRRSLNVATLLFMLSASTLALAQSGGQTEPTKPTAEPAPAAAPASEAKPDDGKDPNVRRDVSQYNLERGKPAIQGYDPVAYFPEGGGKPAKGDAKFAYAYRGVTYHFVNQKNLDAFKAEPTKFEPAYGGWCAYAAANSDKVEIDPTSFKITDGRLFLFYKGFLNDTRASWVKEEAKLTPKADAYWKKIAHEDPPKKKTGG